MTTGVVQLVSEQAGRGRFDSGRGASDCQCAVYRCRQWPFSQRVFLLCCTLAVKETAVVSNWARCKGVKERQAQLCAEGSRRTRRVRTNFKGLRSDENVHAAPASTCLSLERKACTSGDKGAPAKPGVLWSCGHRSCPAPAAAHVPLLVCDWPAEHSCVWPHASPCLEGKPANLFLILTPKTAWDKVRIQSRSGPISGHWSSASPTPNPGHTQ